MDFTLSVSDCRGVGNNTHYPRVMTIRSEADLAEAALHDHVAGIYRNHHRSSADLLQANCIVMDCDNDGTDDPNEWKIPADLQAVFPVVEYYAVYSRNHRKQKRDKSPRPRWHVYFPLHEPITDAAELTERKDQLQKLFPALDPAAKDASRQLFGVERPSVEHYPGAHSVVEVLPPLAEARAVEQFTPPAPTPATTTAGKYERDFLLEALKATPCSQMSRDEWVRVGMALKAAGYPYEVFDEWSATDPARYHESANRKQWDSFSGPGSSGGIGAGTVYHLAAQYGYHRPTVKELRAEKAQAEYAEYLESLQYLEPPYSPREAAQADKTDDMQEPAKGRNADPEAAEAARRVLNEREEYLKSSAGSHLIEFAAGVAAAAATRPIPTHFLGLDTVLDGGLYEGLYIIGAISSLGKTSLCLQICDQIAKGAAMGEEANKNGNDVLIFSLEMARTELMSKSISRETLQVCVDYGYDIRNAKTARGITAGYRYNQYSQDELTVIRLALKQYGKYADRIFIHEGVGDLGVNRVRQIVYQHINVTGRKPVVLVDYLQILAPADVRATDKQNTDKAVLELKRISRDFKIPVLTVSSFNRDNYDREVCLQSFKESGSIEYSSDVLVGLQFEGTGAKGFNADAAAAQNPRKVELKILKNRNGPRSRAINFDYYPAYNFFEEC